MGFQDQTAEQRAKAGAKGGKVKNKNKGFGSLTPEERKEQGRRAAQKRWLSTDKDEKPLTSQQRKRMLMAGGNSEKDQSKDTKN